MHSLYRYFTLILAAASLLACSEERKIIPGTSLELSIERKEAISNLKYALSFDIPASVADSIPASVTIRFDLKNTSKILQLDFNAPTENIRKIEVNGKVVATVHENEHILVASKFLRDGANAIHIEFIAGEAALNRNAEYLYTLFVPSRASSCFPVFDQPDLKAVYHLELAIPMTWKAISNGKVTSIDSSGGKQRYSFSDTQPTSTYQFAFAAGQFRVASDPETGMTFYYRETDSAKISSNVSKIFKLHRESLAWLKEYTGISYPFEKFEFALIPAFQFGGMEHPGSIFYRESLLMLDPSASVNNELRRASLIAHETAHMWFGNLVTMKWFNDVWLKEVFANFMAAKIVNPAFPQINHSLRFLMNHYPAAYDIDRSQGSHPIQQPLDHLKNAGSVYGAIIYQKAPIMMRNLETLMGDASFRAGLQEYLASYSYQNATWDDLINVMNHHTDKDLAGWDRAWIKSKGMPEISSVPLAGTDKVDIRVTNDSEGVSWPQFFYYKISAGGKEAIETIEIGKGSAVLTHDPRSPVIPNYAGRGYGYFRADAASIEFMLNSLQGFESPEARAGVWINIWEYVVRGELGPESVLQKLLSALGKERDPLLLEYLTDKIDRIFWQFLSPAQRQMISPSMDEIIFERLALEKDNSLKRTFFDCYRHVAISKQGKENLRKLWKDEITAGLEFSERDHIQLAFELALREVEGHEAILVEQMNKIKNPDSKAEFQFIMPALSGDTLIRNKFFESLKSQRNRTHEPWVLEAQRYLHHPLRSGYSMKYVRVSLQLLEEMQRTGDIFFPKGWLDATLGGYQAAAVASEVRAYLKENSSLRPDLRNKLLQSADGLFRAEQIVKDNLEVQR